MNHYVYKIFHPAGWEYIGVRSCKCSVEKDSYMGSGSQLKKLFRTLGKESFSKRILCVTSTETEAVEVEKELLTTTYRDDPMCLNIVAGGGGKHKRNCKKRTASRNGMYCIQHLDTIETLDDMEDAYEMYNHNIEKSLAGIGFPLDAKMRNTFEWWLTVSLEEQQEYRDEAVYRYKLDLLDRGLI